STQVAAHGASLVQVTPVCPIKDRLWWGQDARDQAMVEPTHLGDGGRDTAPCAGSCATSTRSGSRRAASQRALATQPTGVAGGQQSSHRAHLLPATATRSCMVTRQADRPKRSREPRDSQLPP